MAINLSKNRDAIIGAWKDVVDDKTGTDWALFGYEGLSNDLKVVSKGDGGIEELKDELNSGQIMYAFLKVLDPKTSLPKCVLINWQGEGAPLVRKGTCANHIRDITNILRGAHVTINARNDEEVDPEVVIEKVVKSTGYAYSFKERIGDVDRQTAPVGTTYKRVIPKNEINITERDKFWQKEEEEEKRRIAEEKKKQEALRAQAEKERLEREALVAQGRESPERTSKRNDSVRQEAEQLIKMRNFDPRSVFEKNTSAGQLNSRKSSLQTPVDVSPTKEGRKIQSTWPPPEQKVDESTIPQNVPVIEAPQREEKLTIESIDNPVLQGQEAHAQEQQFVEDFNGTDYLDLENLGLRAEALYDYQAADETEISFDPGDIITHIDQIDTGWWQGLAPDGTFGLFPANYVQLLD